MGRLQAAKFHKAYHHIPFDKVYSSELKRTIQSVDPFIQQGHTHEVMSEFNEINWGVFEGKVSTPESHRKYLDVVEDWRAGLIDRRIEGGESPRDLQKRQERGLQKLMQREHERQLLLCMHGRAMRSFLCLLTGEPLSSMDQFKHSNLCLYVVQENGGFFDIVEANSVDHLWI